MPKSRDFSNRILGLIFRAEPIPNIADNAGTGPLTNLWISLHSAPVSVGGDQSNNEITGLGGLTRIAIVRTSLGWAPVSASQQMRNAALAQFGEISSGTATATDVAIGTSSGNPSTVLYSGALSASRSLSTGIQPQFAANALTVQET